MRVDGALIKRMEDASRIALDESEARRMEAEIDEALGMLESLCDQSLCDQSLRDDGERAPREEIPCPR
ncbi:MAG: hypothetical protein FWE09_09095 [Treponema sp.]|nr:hypothetical protein [Treponema sp.]